MSVPEHNSDPEVAPEARDARDDELARAADEEAARARQLGSDPEPSLGARLARIGILGWMIVVPMLGALFAGRWLDARLGTGVLFAAASMMLGAAFGLWLAWRWMHEQ